MKQWARKFHACIICGCTDTKHMGKGKCARCYSSLYLALHSARCKRQKHEHYLRNGGAAFMKVVREQRHFDGKREAVLRRDRHRCRACGSPYKLLVHHRDGNGRGQRTPNNNLSNLVTLCRSCHMSAHRGQLMVGRGFADIAGWAPKYGLNACRNCRRSDLKHNANGLCSKCYYIK